MSYKADHHSLNTPLISTQEPLIDFDNLSESELKKRWLDALKNGITGICFSLYEDGQEPGDIITKDQVQRRIDIIKPYTNWVRSFSCIEGNEHIPELAHKNGLKTMVGAWLSDDIAANELEIEGLIDLAKKGYVTIAAVGNEVMYRGELSEEQLLAYIFRVKEAVPDIEVGYVDAYYEFTDHPKIVEACDVILSNCYPYWEGTSFDDSLGHMQHMFNRATEAARGKKVIITETGWPSKGENFKGAVPSEASAMKYFINTQIWAKNEDIDVFYFSSFDESWKVGAEGDVGAYWGIWDKNENLKFH
ncbi:MAG: exo-beta-1,3-glucanase (GH17 family) [Salibacteraceae bacterium]|jgi:exo-beta-1,3-glucanase (GH17 family)